MSRRFSLTDDNELVSRLSLMIVMVPVWYSWLESELKRDPRVGQWCNNLGIISIKVRAKLSSGTEMKRMGENTGEYTYSSEKLWGENQGLCSWRSR